MIIVALLRLSLRLTDGVVLYNRDDLEVLRKHNAISQNLNTLLVNGSGVNLAQFPAKPPRPQVLSFLMVARLLRDKGVLEYIAAAHEVKKTAPHVEFVLVGPLDPNPSGITSKEVEQWVLGGDILYHPETSNVRSFLENCTVFVLPSYREGIPRSTLEAMAVGRAIITTDVPGCRETVIDGQNGFLVPPRDSKALAAAMRKLIESPDLALAMGERSRSLVRDRFDVRRVNEALLKFFGLTATQL